MDYIYNSNIVKIKTHNENKFLLTSSDNNYFIEILKLFNIELQENDSDIIFSVNSIVTLSDYLNKKTNKLLEIYDTEDFLQDIIKQIQYLENTNKTVSYFSLDDFLIINNCLCLFINLNKIHSFDENGNFKLLELIKQDEPFLSPELKSITNIPSSIYYKSCYYSFGLLLLKIFINVNLKNTSEFHDKSKSIYGLPVYWFINNTIVDKPNDRYILFI